MNIEQELKNELGESVKCNVPLNDFVGFKTGGAADYFFAANSQEELVRSVVLASKLKLPYFILGGGYNILLSDQGFSGLVIRNETKNIAFDDQNSQAIVDSGVPLGRLITLAASRELGGLEFLYGIPGTIGGAVYGNIGSFGHEICEHIRSVVFLMKVDGEYKIVKKEPEWMNFSYRSTRLKSEYSNIEEKPVILTVKFQLARRRKDEILGLIQQYINQKKETQPLADKSAGSFFKNPGIGKERAAGYLLEKIGAKKMRVGGATVSKRHANFIVNSKHSTAENIKDLADKLKLGVQEKFNIKLEEEIEYIGRW